MKNSNVESSLANSPNSSRNTSNFITVFSKQPRMLQVTSDQVIPTFLPPMRESSRDQYKRSGVEIPPVSYSENPNAKKGAKILLSAL
jgi:hypothetical protein